MDVPMDYHVWGTMLEHYQRHTKAGQHNANIRDRFADDTEWFASQLHWHNKIKIVLSIVFYTSMTVYQ